ncbi:hypothetical protein ACRRTK_016798 [Alexandromys fortis]
MPCINLEHLSSSVLLGHSIPLDRSPGGPSHSGSPASLRAARAPERSPSLSVTAVCAFILSPQPHLFLLFSFPLLPLSRLVTEVRPIAALPAGAGFLLIGPLGARSRLRSSAGAGQTKDAGSGSGNREQPITVRPPSPGRARVRPALAPGERPAPGLYHSEGGGGESQRSTKEERLTRGRGECRVGVEGCGRHSFPSP